MARYDDWCKVLTDCRKFDRSYSTAKLLECMRRPASRGSSKTRNAVDTARGGEHTYPAYCGGLCRSRFRERPGVFWGLHSCSGVGSVPRHFRYGGQCGCRYCGGFDHGYRRVVFIFALFLAECVLRRVRHLAPAVLARLQVTSPIAPVSNGSEW